MASRTLGNFSAKENNEELGEEGRRSATGWVSKFGLRHPRDLQWLHANEEHVRNFKPAARLNVHLAIGQQFDRTLVVRLVRVVVNQVMEMRRGGQRLKDEKQEHSQAGAEPMARDLSAKVEQPDLSHCV